MMAKVDLLKEISQTLTKNKVQHLTTLVFKANASIEQLLQLTFHEKSKIAFRAAWLLEHVLAKYPNVFIPHLSIFLQLYPQQNNPSCQRHFTKIMMDLYSERPVRDWLLKERDPIFRDVLKPQPDEILEPIVEATFQWLIDSKTPVAVKVNCLDILFYFSKRFDWIVEELQNQIEVLLKEGSAAIQSRGRKILAKLKGGNV